MHERNHRAANHLSISHPAQMEREMETLSVGQLKGIWKRTIIETDGYPWQGFEGKTRWERSQMK